MHTKVFFRLGKLTMLAAIISIAFSASTYAATCYWVGNPGPNNEWDDSNNWSDDSATDVGYNGAGDCAATSPAGYPDGGDDIAIFDNGSDENVLFDISPSVSSITLESGYDGELPLGLYTLTAGGTSVISGGEISMGTGTATFSGLTISGGDVDTGSAGVVTVNGAFEISSGTFTGTTGGELDANGNFTISGGTFTAPATLRVASAFNVDEDHFTGSATGTLTFDGSTWSSVIVSGGDSRLEVYDIIINKTTSYIRINGGSLDATHNLYLTDGEINGGTAYATGEVTFGDNFDGGDGLVYIDGTGTHTSFVQNGNYPDITLNNANHDLEFEGDATLDNGFTILSNSSVSLTDGSLSFSSTATFRMDAGTFNANSSTISVYTWDQNGGDFVGGTGSLNVGAGDLTLTGGSFTAPDMLEITCADNCLFTINDGESFTAPNGGSLEVTGTLNMYKGGSQTGTYTLTGGTLEFVGGDFGYARSTDTMNWPNIVFNKTSDRYIYFSAGDYVATNSLTLTDGYFADGTLKYTGSNAGFTHGNAFGTASQAGGGETLEFGGAYTYNLNESAYSPNIHVNNASAMILPSGTGTLTLNDRITVTQGTFRQASIVGGFNWTLAFTSSNPNIIMNGGSFIGNATDVSVDNVDMNGGSVTTGSGSWYIGSNDFDMDGGTFDASAITSGVIQAVDNFLVDGGTFIAPNGGKIRVQGTYDSNGSGVSFTTTGSTLEFYGTDFTYARSTDADMDWPYIEFNKAHGDYVRFQNDFTATTKLTLIDGYMADGEIYAEGDVEVKKEFDGSTGTSRVDFIGTADQTLYGDHTSTEGILPHIYINKPISGTITLGNGVNNSLRMGTRNWVFNGGDENTVDATTNDSTIYFAGTISLDGEFNPLQEFDNLVILSGTTTLTGDIDVNGDLTISGGTLNANGNDIYLAGDWYHSGGTWTPGSGKVDFDGPSGQTINDSNTFNDIAKSVTAASVLYFEAGETQTVSGTATLGGATGQLLTLQSTSAGVPANIAPAVDDIDYVAIHDVDNTRGTDVDLRSSAKGHAENTDLGDNNQGWLFDNPYTGPTPIPEFST